MTREVNVLPVDRRRPVWRRGGAFDPITSSAVWRMRATRKRCSSHSPPPSRNRDRAEELLMKRRGCVLGIAARRSRTCCAVTLRGSCDFFFASGVAAVVASTAGLADADGVGLLVLTVQPPSSSTANKA